MLRKQDIMENIFLGEMNMDEVKAFFKKGGDTVIVPIGTTEQHGPHLPYLTDTLIPFEVAKRAAKRMGALVAPPLPYGMSQGHRGFPGIIYLSGKTLTSVLEELALSLADSGFRRIIFVNGHYCNDQPLFVAVNDATANPNLPKGTRVYGITYWNVMSPEVLERYLSWKAGWHANIGETSAVLAVNENLVNMKSAPVEWPDMGEDTTTLNMSAAQSSGFFLVTKSGIWGDARKSTKQLGDEFIDDAAKGLAEKVAKYQKTYEKNRKD